ncbi:MAG: hypothetical protein Q8M76_12690 [Spirochaetaceae bacterium]|nr:hypothetical protein [Spirochaetaceae bacterium]
MKKIVIALLAVSLLSLGGCASMLKTFGGVTAADAGVRNDQVDQEIAALRQSIDELNAKAALIEEIQARVTKVDELVQRIDELSVRVDEASMLAGTIEELKMAMEDLKGSTVNIPIDTLSRLAAIINRAIEDGSAGTP